MTSWWWNVSFYPSYPTRKLWPHNIWRDFLKYSQMRYIWRKPSHMYSKRIRVWQIKSRIEKYFRNIIKLKFSDCEYFSCWSGKALDVDTFFVYFVFVGHKIIRLFLRVLSQKQDGILLWYINSKLFLYGCKQKICFYLLAQKVVSNKLTSLWWIP